MLSNIETIARIVFDENHKDISQTILDSLFMNIPSEYLVFNISIDLIGLCETLPSEVHIIIRDFLNFEAILKNFIKDEIIKILTGEDMEHAQMISFHDFFDVSFDLSNIPMMTLKTEIRDILKIVQPKYSIVLSNKGFITAESSPEVVSKVCVPLNTLKGRISSKKEEIEQLSSFYMCFSGTCSDKTYLLRLKNTSYAFMDSKKTFTFNTNPKTSTCFKCKTNLVEMMRKKKTKRSFSFILTDTLFSLRCISNVDVGEEEMSEKKDLFLFGHLVRTNKGGINFCFVSTCRIEHTETDDKMTTNVILKKDGRIENDLLHITGLYFYNFKEICSEEDVLLFIILNIINQSNGRILLFTSDPVYASRCSQNILRREGIEHRICYDYKTFNEPSGICIRAYDEDLIKKMKVDHIFNLNITSFLDYKYIPGPTNEIEVNINLLPTRMFDNTIYSSQVGNTFQSFESMFNDYKSIQKLFITFRESYKGLIEPERLFNTLLSLYKSIEGIMKGEKEEQYADFILRYFKDRLI